MCVNKSSKNSFISLMSTVFTNGPEDRGSIPARVIPKTQKIVLDAALHNTQHYKVRVTWSNPGKGLASSAHGIMVLVVGIGHGDPSSNPGRD